eukprot:SM000303S11785  [mRNA]  locus=s303:75901:76304:+ [translate_table: standard]
MAFQMLDVQWLSMGASYMEFNVSGPAACLVGAGHHACWVLSSRKACRIHGKALVKLGLGWQSAGPSRRELLQAEQLGRSWEQGMKHAAVMAATRAQLEQALSMEGERGGGSGSAGAAAAALARRDLLEE